METQELEFVVNALGDKKPISQIHTRLLLSIYRNWAYGYTDIWDYSLSDLEQYRYEMAVAKQIKAELNTREHIPNRKESKLLRQKNAKKFRSIRSKNK